MQPVRISAAESWDADTAVSPDGTVIAYSSNASDSVDIWLIGLTSHGAGGRRQLTSSAARDHSPAWFPDGSSVVFVREEEGREEIRRKDRQVGPSDPSTLVISGGRDPAISPDGSRVAYAERTKGRAYRIAVSSLGVPGSNEIASVLPTDSAASHVQPAWSPDGERLCFADQYHGSLWIMPATGGPARRLTEDGSADREPVWSSDGRSILFSSRRGGTLGLWRISARGGRPERITQGLGPEGSPSVSVAGDRLIYSTFLDDPKIALLGLASGESSVVGGFRRATYPSISADGKSLFFTSNQSGRYAIWKMPIEGARATDGAVRLNDSDAVSVLPDVSPDGQWVVYQRLLDGKYDVWIVSSDGGVSAPLVDWEGVDIHPSWSPTGDAVVFVSDKRGETELWIQNVRAGRPDGQPRVLDTLTDSAWLPSWSPDGTRIAFIGTIDGDTEAWVTPVDSPGSARPWTHGSNAHMAKWDEHGGLLVSGRWGRDSHSIRRIAPDGSVRREIDISTLAGDGAFNGFFEVSRSGELLAIARQSTSGDIWVIRAKNGTF